MYIHKEKIHAQLNVEFLFLDVSCLQINFSNCLCLWTHTSSRELYCSLQILISAVRCRGTTGIFPSGLRLQFVDPVQAWLKDQIEPLFFEDGQTQENVALAARICRSSIAACPGVSTRPNCQHICSCQLSTLYDFVCAGEEADDQYWKALRWNT